MPQALGQGRADRAGCATGWQAWLRGRQNLNMGLAKGKTGVSPKKSASCSLFCFYEWPAQSRKRSLPRTWDAGRPAAYPAGGASRWPRSGGLRFQKALVPHLEKNRPAPDVRPRQRGLLGWRSGRPGTARGPAPTNGTRAASRLSLRHFTICSHDLGA